MGDDNASTAAPGFVVPQWIYIAALVLGIPLAGGSGSLLQAGSTQSQLETLTEKVDALDTKIDTLTIEIAKVHPNADL